MGDGKGMKRPTPDSQIWNLGAKDPSTLCLILVVFLALEMDQTSGTEKEYQRNKYNEIVEILLTAGYFRARIHTLNEFDKVVGGLCWCITSSGESVDVDILFQENLTIGQKISLSEAIVTALRKMGCPSPLQPHQIQGGVGGADYPAIHQVIVWLVKKYFERRVEREQQLRSYSMFQFSKSYQLPGEAEASTVSPTLSKILTRHKATRLFKRRANRREAEETRVRSCLLEFGETFAKLGGGVVEQESAKGKGGAGASSTAGAVGGAAKGAPSAAAADHQGRPSGTSGSVSASTTASAYVATKVPGGAVGGGMDAAAIAGARGKLKAGAPAGHAAGAKGSEPSAAAEGGAPLIDAMDIALADLSRLDISEMSGFEKQLARAAKEAKKDELLLAEKASREESELMQQMYEIDESAVSAISGAQIGNIVGLGASEISSASAQYQAELEDAQKELDDNLATGRLGAAAAFNRQMQGLLKAKDELTARETDVLVKTAALQERGRVAEDERAAAQDYIAQLRAQFKKFSDLESASTQQKELNAIKNLMTLSESLKAKEADFKAQCKAKRSEYLEKIRALDEEEDVNTPEMQQQQQIEQLHAKVSSKYNRLRQMLAEANLEVAAASRMIDDTPSRTELIQYERRFVELYQQVAWKLEETRKYYDMYNTLDTTLGFLQKEVVCCPDHHLLSPC